MCADLLYPEREQVIFIKDKGNNTNYCVSGRGNLRKLVLTGSCVAFKHQSRGAQLWGWDSEPRFHLLQGRVLGWNVPYPQMGSFACEVSAPTYTMLPQLVCSFPAMKIKGQGRVQLPVLHFCLKGREFFPLSFADIHKGNYCYRWKTQMMSSISQVNKVILWKGPTHIEVL